MGQRALALQESRLTCVVKPLQEDAVCAWRLDVRAGGDHPHTLV